MPASLRILPQVLRLTPFLGLPLAAAAQAPPGTDIWILELGGDGTEVLVDTAARATDRDGYDNQPHFLPGGEYLLYTSIDASGQADIYRYDVTKGTAVRLTRTEPESEYSATPIPSEDRFSVIRVEADSTQRLWSFDLDGRDARLVLPGIEPVGYHAWIDEARLALFVLGSPSTLRVAATGIPGQPEDSAGKIVARNIGRSLHKIPGSRKVSFVQWEESDEGWIVELNLDSGDTRPLAPLLEGNEFYAWTPSGVILAGRGSLLYRWVPGASANWEEIADLTSLGIQDISRIAVSLEGGLLAVVGTR